MSHVKSVLVARQFLRKDYFQRVRFDSFSPAELFGLKTQELAENG